MNYSKLSELLSNKSLQTERDLLLDHYYYSNRIDTDTSIKLHRNHIPLNPKVLINTQQQYNFYIETLLYLEEQCDLGFQPSWFITFHYQHPSEKLKQRRETCNEYGWRDRIGFTSKRPMWNEVSYYKHWDHRRNLEDQVLVDTSQIKNVILKTLFGIKRLNRTDRNNFPNLFFFHEKGKTKLQYHTHLLLPKTKSNHPEKEIKEIFDTSIRKRCMSISQWKSIDIKPISNTRGLIGYLNKETNPNHISFDFYNSVPISQTH
tara:strand:+ start:762 stop:1544 length:783 start_codon:yes stop_codon:yes gene_type:complete